MVLCREEFHKVSSRLGVEASGDPGEGERGTVHFVGVGGSVVLGGRVGGGGGGGGLA